MSTRRQIPWARLGVEGLVVVTSILLALAVDQWRGNLTERQLETEYLERLRADLEANLGVIGLATVAHESRLESAHLIYPLVSYGDWSGLDTATAVRASYLATPASIPQWIDDTFQELISTGRMALIEDASLRAELLAYYRALDVQDYTYELMSTAFRDSVRERMAPALQLRLRADCNPRRPSCPVPMEDPGIPEYLEWLVSNPSLALDLNRHVVQWTRGLQEYLPRAEESTRSIIGRIDQTLAG